MGKDGTMFSRPLFFQRSLLMAWAVACLHFAGAARADTQQRAATSNRSSNGAALTFSAEQVSHGAQVYAGTCAMCHGTSLEGGHDVPDLGSYFTARWANAPLAQLTGYISRAMPLMAPGTLSSQDTVALVAFLLRQNGVRPSSNTPMPVDERQLAKLYFPAMGIATSSWPELHARKNSKTDQ